MKIKLKDIDIAAKLPKMKSVMPVFEVKTPSFQERVRAIDLFREVLDLGKTSPVHIQDSLHLISRKGEIQYYKPSGSLWVINNRIDKKYSNERRNWKNIIKIQDPDDPQNIKLALAKKEQKKLFLQSKELFRRANLLSRESYFYGVDLDQASKLNEQGKEVGRFAGEANVKFLYKIDDIKVEGPGAKTYAFYNPGKRKHELKGIYHAWRNISSVHEISMPGIEESLERALSDDKELLLHKRKGSSIKLSKIDLIYFSFSPFKYQDYLFPALRVVGSVVPQKNRLEGFEISRYYNAAAPKSYIKAGIYADYLACKHL